MLDACSGKSSDFFVWKHPTKDISDPPEQFANLLHECVALCERVFTLQYLHATTYHFMQQLIISWQCSFTWDLVLCLSILSTAERLRAISCNFLTEEIQMFIISILALNFPKMGDFWSQILHI